MLTSNGVQTAKDENDKITMYGLGGFRLISQNTLSAKLAKIVDSHCMIYSQ